MYSTALTYRAFGNFLHVALAHQDSRECQKGYLNIPSAAENATFVSSQMADTLPFLHIPNLDGAVIRARYKVPTILRERNIVDAEFVAQKLFDNLSVGAIPQKDKAIRS